MEQKTGISAVRGDRPPAGACSGQAGCWSWSCPGGCGRERPPCLYWL